jgi:hypothetical protein
MSTTTAAARAGHAPLRLAGALLAAVVLPPLVVTLIHPGFFRSAALAVGLTPFVGAVAYLVATATAEEAAKALSIGVADLKRARLSWFWLTTACAGLMGLVEAALRSLSHLDLDGLFLVAAGIRTTSGHVALSMVCLAAARATGNWVVAVALAGVLHALVNWGGMSTWSLALYDYLTFAAFIVVIGLAFAWRARLDWRQA